MPVWIDFFELIVICPKCSFKFPTLFYETGDLKRIPVIIISLANGIVKCPVCRSVLEDSDLTTL